MKEARIPLSSEMAIHRKVKQIHGKRPAPETLEDKLQQTEICVRELNQRAKKRYNDVKAFVEEQLDKVKDRLDDVEDNLEEYLDLKDRYERLRQRCENLEEKCLDFADQLRAIREKNKQTTTEQATQSETLKVLTAGVQNLMMRFGLVAGTIWPRY
jgi:archaellum component FlaC